MSWAIAAPTAAVKPPTTVQFTEGTAIVGTLPKDTQWTSTHQANGTVLIKQGSGTAATTLTLPKPPQGTKISWEYIVPVPPCDWGTPPAVTPSCPDGSHQTNGSWVHTDVCPIWIYQNGVCPPPVNQFQWKAPVPPSQFTAISRPAKGASYLTFYGTTVTRFTDHEHDLGSAVAWLTDIYSRHQGFNANDSMLAAYRPDGGYEAYNVTTRAAIKSLNGVGGDPEFQWDVNDPNIGYYLGNNGSTILRRIDVAANTSSVQYDFTNDVHSIAPDANRWSTKTEGSPSANGCIWSLMGRHEQSGTWPTRAYVALDICAKRVIWSKVATTEFDSISTTPSGRWAVGNGTGNTPTTAFKLDNSGISKVLMDHGEHNDICALPNGHDALVVCNYKSGPDDGKCYSIDIDNGTRIDHFSLYNNPIVGTDYAVHISCKAFNAPGWAVIGTYGSDDNKSNLMLLDIPNNHLYGLSTLFANVPGGSYWPEPHAFPNRDLTKVCYNEDWGSWTNNGVDIVCMNVPPLPTAPPIIQMTPNKTATKTIGKPAYSKKPVLIKD